VLPGVILEFVQERYMLSRDDQAVSLVDRLDREQDDAAIVLVDDASLDVIANELAQDARLS